MINPASLLEGLSAADPAARQEAKQTLEEFIHKNKLSVAVSLAEQVQNDQQARIVSSIIGRAIYPWHLSELILLTNNDKGWVSSIARRAIRTWLESASPSDASQGLQLCLIAAMEQKDSRTDEFLCAVILEKVSQEAHLAYRPLLPLLKSVIAQRSGPRNSMTWFLGTPPPGVLNAYQPALSALEELLPESDLPLPAEAESIPQSLPLPAEGNCATSDSARLPLPTQTRGAVPEPPRSLWARLFGRKAP